MNKITIHQLENTFVTADHHLGHENIIKFCNRPFNNADEMDQVLIDNWNSVVSPNDTVYHLSDLTLGGIKDAVKYLNQLNGRILILGNHWHHDKRWLPKNFFGPMSLEYPEYHMNIGHVDIVPPMVVLEVEGMGNEGRPLPIVLCHYPLEVWDRKHYGAWHLYGHTHEPDTTGLYRLNVGVDCMNYSPISLDGVLQYMYELGW